ncbi:MAG: M67 family metallopeptidase [Actinobacteria bacterium]|nr:M67 family metallopeptidase [Actinomycetota bacterium]
MLKINQKVVDEIYRHAVKESPLEACGYLAGSDNTVFKNYAMTNIDKSTDHFTMDINEQFMVIKKAKNEGLKIIAVYHSHPNSPARLSEEDRRLANDPGISYVIVSIAENKLDIKSFKLKNRIFKEEKLKIIAGNAEYDSAKRNRRRVAGICAATARIRELK